MPPQLVGSMASGWRVPSCFRALAAVLIHVSATGAEPAQKLDFNKQIRPILSENCFKCHGADEKQRKGKLRLDVRDQAVAKKAIVPGKPDQSKLVERLYTKDPEDLMPPPKENHQLSEADKDTLKRWIAEGAEYKKHWAFIPPVKGSVPQVTNPQPGGNEIDAFVLQKLEELHLQPAAAAPKEQWLRRVTFALTGLPPSLQELDAFHADTTPEAREHVVDRLLRSPSYGEHIGKDWLDSARYADSYGRHEDGDMLVWPWRDWVIKAFNENLPYDQFITWQTAGDMLPNPTRDQLVATAFNRLALESNESGNDPEEFRLDQVSDRVRANGLAFMGLTVECAKCHDHKYDPITQKDYWQMAAFFDNIDENGVYSQFCPAATPSPSMLLPTPEQQTQMDAVDKKIADQEQAMQTLRQSSQAEFQKWIAEHGVPCTPVAGVWNTVKSWFDLQDYYEWRPKAVVHLDFEAKSIVPERQMVNRVDKDKPAKLRTRLELVPGPRGNTAMLMKGDDEVAIPKIGEWREYNDFSFAVWLQPREHRDRAVVVCSSRGGNDDGRGYELIMENEVLSLALMHFVPGNEIRVKAKRPLPMNQWTHVAATYDGSSHAAGLKIYINGELEPTEVVHDHLIKDITRLKEWGDIDQDQVRFTLGGREHDSPLKNCGVDDFWVFNRAISQGEVKALMGKEATADEWCDWWLRYHSDAWKKGQEELTQLRMQRTDVLKPVLEMMVMQELPKHRENFLHIRGSAKQRGDLLQPDAPAAVLPYPKDLPRNRLGFAKWLTNPQHPLTSRVAVNRIWQVFFGRGLVGTPQDFGTRGEMPSNLELLDWLACDFMEHGWNVKRLCRMIALSNTFGQSVTPVDPKTYATDLENKWLARGPLVRLTAEEVRDQALACEGLLSAKIGGPSARPYMTPGLYHDSGLQQRYDQDKGEGLYRRSMYSFWRRTLPPPELMAFDAPTREVCTLKREKTNSPLQALVLLNSEQFVEAQRVIAENVLRKFPDETARCAAAFRIMTSRLPTDAETAIMVKLLRRQREYYQKNYQESVNLRTNGDNPPDGALNPVEVAATAMLVRTLMSHAESINR